MKKILSLVMALTMVLGLNAAPVALKQQKARKSTSRMELVQKQKTAQPVTHQTAVKHAPKQFRHIDRTAMRKAPMAATTVTFAPADFVDQGTEGTGSAISVTKDGVTVATDKGYGSRDYNTKAPDQFRVYDGGKLTISATSTITKIEFQFASKNDKVMNGGMNNSYTPNNTTWTMTMDGQARITAITVTLDGDTPTPPTPSGELYTIDFTASQGGWTIQDEELSGLSYVWKQDAQYGMKASAYNKQAYAAESWLISPTIDLTSATEATLKLNQAVNKGAADNLKVKVTTDNGQSWNNLTINMPAGTSWNYQVDETDLTAYVGNEIKLAFVYVSTTSVCPTWQIKDLVITGDGDTPTPPTPEKDTIYSVINHPMVMDSIADFGWIYVSGNNDDYSLCIQVNTDHLLGEFTNDDIEYEYTQMIDWAAYDYVDIESVPSVVIAQVEDTLRFTVTIKATDGQVYVVTMNDFDAQPTGEETYVDIVLPEVYDMTEEEGWFQVLGYDVTGEYYASLCVNTDNMFGSFTDGDMDWEYTGVYIGETTVQLVENSMTITVSAVGDTVVYRAEVLDVDGMKWIITMKDFTPTPTEIIDLVTIEADGEYSAEYGDYYAMGVTADGDEISLDIYMDKLASGTFTLEDVETYYSGITLASGQLVEFYSADITLIVESGNVLIEAVIIGRDIKQYNVTMEIAGAQPSGDHTIVLADYAAISFTTLDGAYTVASSQNGGASAPTYNGTSEDLRLYAKNTFTLTKNTKDGPMTKIIFCISDKGLARQADIAVSAGEIVSYDMTNALVTWEGEASEVVFTVGEKATHGSDGANKAGQFDFTAIDIEYAATGLISTKANKVADKCFINGQLMIIKDGKQYNVLGVAF